MKNKMISDVLGKIDDKYIAESAAFAADPAVAVIKRSYRIKIAVLAAGIAVLGGVIFAACAVIFEQREYRQMIEHMLNMEGYDKEKINRLLNGTDYIEHVGTVPEWLKNVVDADLFKGATAYSDRLLKQNGYVVDANNRIVENKITMMDIYGNIMAECALHTDYAYNISDYAATEDGGFIFTLGFYEYDYWVSGVHYKSVNTGFASRIIKCDADGRVQFDVSLKGIEGRALGHITEKNGCYYIFGTHRDAAQFRTFGETDIYVLVLDQKGEQIAERLIKGSNFDSLHDVIETEYGFLIYASSQSNDGDFTPIDSDDDVYNAYNWIITIDTSLNITERKKVKTQDFYSDLYNRRIGERNGEPIFQNDDMFREFDAGVPSVFIDYGDFYLVVSTHITGYKTTIPTFSSLQCYTETVYSGYDNDGVLLFRTAIDS